MPPLMLYAPSTSSSFRPCCVKHQHAYVKLLWRVWPLAIPRAGVRALSLLWSRMLGACLLNAVARDAHCAARAGFGGLQRPRAWKTPPPPAAWRRAAQGRCWRPRQVLHRGDWKKSRWPYGIWIAASSQLASGSAATLMSLLMCCRSANAWPSP